MTDNPLGTPPKGGLVEVLEKAMEMEFKPSPTSSRDIDEKADDIFDRVSNRAKVIAWIDEYVVTEEFMNKVRRYARMEIDSMLLGLTKSVLGIALGTAIALLVTFLITGKFT